MAQVESLTQEQIDEIRAFRNKTNQFAQFLGITCVESREGYARCVLPVSDSLRNPQGSVHGGVLYTIADVAAANAASTYGIMIATQNADIHFLSAGLSLTEVSAEATVIKHGKRSAVITIYVKDQDGKVLAYSTMTFASLGKPIVIE